MTTTIDAIRAEYLRYKTMAEAAIAQLKSRRGTDWVSLSIPPGQSDRYNESLTSERASAHAQALQSRTDVKR